MSEQLLAERAEETTTPIARPRLGFLGVGWIGRHRLQAISRAACADILYVSDVSEDNVAEAAKCAPGSLPAASLEDMLSSGLDGIVIATPNQLHMPQCLAALEAGCAVFCQKPLARTEEEVRAILSAAWKADRLLGVDLSYRHVAGMQRIRQLVAEGALGEIYAVDLVFHNAYGPDKKWFFDMAQSGGGCMLDLGIHLIDLALWTLGFPDVATVSSRLFAQGRQLYPGEEVVEDYGEARIDLGTGASVRVVTSWNLHAGCDAIIEAHFHGTRGGASLRNVAGSFFDFQAEEYHGRQRVVLAQPPDDWGGRAAVAWARQLASSPRYRPEADHLATVARVLDRIYGR